MPGSVSCDHSHQNWRRELRPLTLPKLETAAASHLYHVDMVAKQCQGVKGSHAPLVHLQSCVVQFEPLSLPIYHTSLDKAECCFPLALTCFRNADLVKASPSHIFF